LRFDVPQVWSNVTRVEAFTTSAVCVLAPSFCADCRIYDPWCRHSPPNMG